MNAVERTDAQLIEAYIAGDSAAFSALIRRHADLVYAAARQRTGDPAAADDVTQAVFVVLARKAAGLRHRVTIAGWLLGVTRHVALTANRAAARRARHERAAAKPEVNVIDSPSTGTSPEFLNVLGDALLTLRSVERDAITLRFFQGLSMADVGHLLGTGEDAARKRVSRALDKLRHRLLRRGMAMPAGGLAVSVTLLASQPAPAGVVASASAASGTTITPLAGKALAMLAIKKGMVMATAVLGAAIAVRAVTAQTPSTPPTPLAVATTAPAATNPAAEPPAATTANAATGRVLKPDGSPAAGAFVCLSTSAPGGGSKIAGTGVTDGGGNFTIPFDGPLQDPRLTADMPQAGLTRVLGFRIGESVDLTLAPAATARIRILLPDGKPAVGLRVWPSLVNFPSLPGGSFGYCLSIEDHLKRWAVLTDADGVATIGGLPAGGRVTLATDDPRFATLTFEDGTPVEVNAGGALPSVQLMLAGQISGRVIYSGIDAPAAGLIVYTRTITGASHSSGGDATTNGDGRFIIAGLKPGPFVVHLNSRSLTGPWCAAAARIELGAGEHATADLHLIHGGLITGHVRDVATGQGIGDLDIVAHCPTYSAEAGSAHSAKTDARGYYEVRVPPGHAEVYITSPIPKGFSPPALGTPTRLAPLDVADGAVVPLDFDLHPDNVPNINGTIVDGDGKPMAGAVVSWVGDHTEMPGEQTARCDQTGRFTIHETDTLTLRARAGKLATLAAVVVEPGAAPVTLRVADGAQYNVVATVIDAAGRPVPTAMVDLNINYGRFGSGGLKRPVDAGGVIRFEGLYRDSSYSFWADAPGFGVTQSKVRPPAAGVASSTTTLQLVRADQHISGVVVDDDGTGVPNLDVTLNGSTTGLMKTRTDNDGRFDFAVVADASGLIFFPRVAPTPNKPGIVTDAKAGQTDLRIAIPTVSIPN